MHPKRKQVLSRRALAKAVTSAGLMSKVQAMGELVRAGDLPAPVATVRRELLTVLGNRLDTYQAGRASSMAGRLLEALEGDGTTVEWPSEAPGKRAAVGAWPFCPGGPYEHDEGDWESLFLCQTEGQRDGWRERVEGPPPWRR